MRWSPQLLRVIAYLAGCRIDTQPSHSYPATMWQAKAASPSPSAGRARQRPRAHPSTRHPPRPVAPHPRAQGGAVLANRRDMRIAVVAREDRPQEGRQHRTLVRRSVALVSARAVCHPRIEQAAHFEKLDEAQQLPERRHPTRRGSGHKTYPTRSAFSALPMPGILLHRQSDLRRTKKYPANPRPASLKLIGTTIQLPPCGRLKVTF